MLRSTGSIRGRDPSTSSALRPGRNYPCAEWEPVARARTSQELEHCVATVGRVSPSRGRPSHRQVQDTFGRARRRSGIARPAARVRCHAGLVPRLVCRFSLRTSGALGALTERAAFSFSRPARLAIMRFTSSQGPSRWFTWGERRCLARQIGPRGAGIPASLMPAISADLTSTFRSTWQTNHREWTVGVRCGESVTGERRYGGWSLRWGGVRTG